MHQKLTFTNHSSESYSVPTIHQSKTRKLNQGTSLSLPRLLFRGDEPIVPRVLMAISTFFTMSSSSFFRNQISIVLIGRLIDCQLCVRKCANVSFWIETIMLMTNGCDIVLSYQQPHGVPFDEMKFELQLEEHRVNFVAK